jgi:uncharacterized protein YjbI with pentapeptide repeats
LVIAEKILKQYAVGQRRFLGLNLRGQNFEGRDLSGADFSYSDLRGAVFKNATLKDANFTQIKAGLQRRKALILASLAFFYLVLLLL